MAVSPVAFKRVERTQSAHDASNLFRAVQCERSGPIRRIALLLLFFDVTLASAGAWVTPVDEAYVRVGAATMSTRERYDFSGDRVEIESDPNEDLDPNDDPPTRRYEEIGFFFYAALGLVEHVELNLQTSGKRSELSSRVEDLRTEGLSDFAVGLKVGAPVGAFVVAGQLTAKIPTGYDDEVDPPLGDGQVDVEGRVMGGASLWSLGLPAYAGLEFGYRHRADGPMDELLFLAEAGANFFADAGFRAKVDGQYASDLPSDDESATDLFAFNSRVTKLDAALWFAVQPRLFLEVGVTEILAARNVTAGTTWNVGVSHQFDFSGR